MRTNFVKILARWVDSHLIDGYKLIMSAREFLHIYGLFVCAGMFGLMVAATIFMRLLSTRRERSTGPIQPAVGPYHLIQDEEDDFGGVPTTGSVQEYERDYPVEQIIGSSGFDAQTDLYPSNEDSREHDEESRRQDEDG